MYTAGFHLCEKIYVHVAIHLIYGKGFEGCITVEESGWNARGQGDGTEEFVTSRAFMFSFL